MKSPDRAPYRACICSRVLVSTDDDLALAPSHTAPMELDTHPELIEQVNAGRYATFKAVHRNPVPVIVAVHGVVLGGGIGITGAAEIVPLAARKLLFDKEGKAGGHQDVIAERDECNRASTTRTIWLPSSRSAKRASGCSRANSSPRATPRSSLTARRRCC